jgi:hypothetical protein
MRRRERRKQKRQKRQKRITSKGIAKVSFLTIATLIIVIAGVGFISFRNSSSYPREPMYPSPTISTTKEIDKEAISNTPSPEPQNFTPWEPQNFTTWLEMPSEVPAGTKVPILLKMKNISNQVQTLRHGGGGLEIVVTRQDGTKVYNSPNYLRTSILYIRKLEPGEEYVISREEWEQTDNNGTKVPPGIYIVQPRYRELPPRQLIIVPAPSS